MNDMTYAMRRWMNDSLHDIGEGCNWLLAPRDVYCELYEHTGGDWPPLAIDKESRLFYNGRPVSMELPG